MKAGTTSLYQYLQSHPQISMSSVKEPEFFTDNWDKGRGWYEDLFADAHRDDARGEASTGYTKYPIKRGAPERIASLLPNIRLVYLVRHPIERIYSHHRTLVLNGQEDLSLEDAVQERPDYVAFSSYGMQIDQYLAHFSRDQLLVILSEDLLRDRARTLRRVCEHLGVSGHWRAAILDERFNRTGESRRPRPIKRWLIRVPGFQLARERAPVRLKQLGWRALNRRVLVEDTSTRHPDVGRMLSDMLREDVKALREVVGPAVDRWQLP